MIYRIGTAAAAALTASLLLTGAAGAGPINLDEAVPGFSTAEATETEDCPKSTETPPKKKQKSENGTVAPGNSTDGSADEPGNGRASTDGSESTDTGTVPEQKATPAPTGLGLPSSGSSSGAARNATAEPVQTNQPGTTPGQNDNIKPNDDKCKEAKQNGHSNANNDNDGARTSNDGQSDVGTRNGD